MDSLKFVNFRSQVDQYQINTLRGEILTYGVPSPVGKILVNKVNYYGFELGKRYFETFDPGYLFFTGDMDIKKSTRTEGPLFLSLLPAILIGLFVSLKNSKKLSLYLLAISPIWGALTFSHYETISRIPVFLMISYFAALGVINIWKFRRFLILLTFLFTFEFTRFLHNFLIHYHP